MPHAFRDLGQLEEKIVVVTKNGFSRLASQPQNDTGQRPEAMRTNICMIATLLVLPGIFQVSFVIPSE